MILGDSWVILDDSEQMWDTAHSDDRMSSDNDPEALPLGDRAW